MGGGHTGRVVEKGPKNPNSTPGPIYYPLAGCGGHARDGRFDHKGRLRPACCVRESGHVRGRHLGSRGGFPLDSDNVAGALARGRSIQEWSGCSCQGHQVDSHRTWFPGNAIQIKARGYEFRRIWNPARGLRRNAATRPTRSWGTRVVPRAWDARFAALSYFRPGCRVLLRLTVSSHRIGPREPSWARESR